MYSMMDFILRNRDCTFIKLFDSGKLDLFMINHSTFLKLDFNRTECICSVANILNALNLTRSCRMFELNSLSP